MERKTRPTREEFREKVVEFMKHIDHTMAAFPQTPAGIELRKHVQAALDLEIAHVISGENKEVEKRYKYFVDYA
jgi:hypothetical protein